MREQSHLVAAAARVDTETSEAQGSSRVDLKRAKGVAVLAVPLEQALTVAYRSTFCPTNGCNRLGRSQDGQSTPPQGGGVAPKRALKKAAAGVL